MDYNYYPYYSRYPNRYSGYPSLRKQAPQKETFEEPKNAENNEKRETESRKKIPSKHNSFANINFSNLFSSNREEPIIEILGISLFFDDIIILALLFFLYQEGVQDEILFITLILLLLS